MHTSQALMAARRHWAAVLSRHPMSLAARSAPGERGRCSIGTTTYVSSILPWRGCGSGAPWVGENHAARTENAVSELVSNVAGRGSLVWGGDWNHALTGGVRRLAGRASRRPGSARHPRARGSDRDAAARHRRPAQHRPRRGAARPRGHRVEGLGPARRQAPVRPRRVRARRRGLTLRLSRQGPRRRPPPRSTWPRCPATPRARRTAGPGRPDSRSGRSSRRHDE